MRENARLADYKLLRIRDSGPTYLSATEAACDIQQATFRAEGGDIGKIEEFELFSRESDIASSIRNFCSKGYESIVVDISSFPKRFFFFALRIISQFAHARDIVVTCAIPEHYADDGRPLSEDPEPWRHLPGYMPPYPPATKSILVISIGFESLGLPQIFESGSSQDLSDVRLLFPFPGDFSGVRRNWAFVHELSRFLPNLPQCIDNVDPTDVSTIFSKLMAMSGDGTQPVILAPFGPKTVSLAMCLFAISTQRSSDSRTHATVFYTQPKSYHPSYSSGVKKRRDGRPEIFSYVIRSGGTDFYV